MKIAIMQPYFLPYMAYWQLINAVDTFVIYDDVNFIKRGYINRNSILTNGKVKTFTLELKKSSQNKLINEIEIGDNREKLLKMFKYSYSKTPFFKQVFPILEKIMRFEEKSLSKFIAESLVIISEYLGINTNFIYSSEIKKTLNLKGESKIIDICKKLGAKEYINPIGGIDLYSKKEFDKNGINLVFLESKGIKYKQFKNEFIPNLSIIDVLMFNSLADLNKSLHLYNKI